MASAGVGGDLFVVCGVVEHPGTVEVGSKAIKFARFEPSKHRSD